MTFGPPGEELQIRTSVIYQAGRSDLSQTGGSNCKWENLNDFFEVKDGDLFHYPFHVAVYDHNQLKSDVLIGSANIDVKNLVTNKHSEHQYKEVTLLDNLGNDAGFITLDMILTDAKSYDKGPNEIPDSNKVHPDGNRECVSNLGNEGHEYWNKWFTPTYGKNANIIMNFSKPTKVNSYSISTANDHLNRTPKSWELWGQLYQSPGSIQRGETPEPFVLLHSVLNETDLTRHWQHKTYRVTFLFILFIYFNYFFI